MLDFTPYKRPGRPRLQSRAQITCAHCGRRRTDSGRNLCRTCYSHFWKYDRPGLEAFPLKPKHRHDKTELLNGDPHLRWLFKELDIQGFSYLEVAARAGISSGTLSKWRQHKNPLLSHFKAVLGALGYEILVVAKEPKDEGP